MSNPYSYSSGADEFTQGLQSGFALADRFKKGKMDEETGNILKREQSAEFSDKGLADYKANYEATGGAGTLGADGKVIPGSTGDVGTMGEDGRITYAGTTATPGTRLGLHARDTAYTPAEVREINRADARTYLGTQGEEGAKRIAQMDTEDASDLQRKSLERSERKAASDEKFNDGLKPMYSALSQLTPGTPEHTAAKEKINAAITANDYVKGRENMLTELNLTEKQFDVKKKSSEQAIWEGTASPEALGKMLTEQYHDGKTYGVHTDDKTGEVSIVMEGEGGGVVKTAKSWKDLQDEVRSRIGTHAEAMVANNEKVAAAKKLADSNERIAVTRANAAKAANLKYSSIRDDDGNIYTRQKDNSFRRTDGVEFDPEKHGEPTYLSGPQKLTSAEIAATNEAKTKYVALAKKVEATKGDWTLHTDGKSNAYRAALAELAAHAASFPDSVPKGLQASAAPAAPTKAAPSEPAVQKRTQIPGAPSGYTTDGVNNYNSQGILLKKKGQ